MVLRSSGQCLEPEVHPLVQVSRIAAWVAKFPAG